MPQEAARFDRQAPGFDRRAGLGETVAVQVADGVLAAARLEAGDVLLELGAGTGELGRHLAGGARRVGARYLGTDRSAAMLAVFRQRGTQPPVALARFDAGARWPLSDAAAAAVFGSRVVHLLDSSHVADEVCRACRPRGCLVLGRVERNPDSPTGRLRERRAELMASHGVATRNGRTRERRLLDHLIASGASPLGSRVVATWTVRTTLAEVLAAWEALGRIGGVPLERERLAAVGAQLRAWAARELGDLDTARDSQESYVLDGVRLPARRPVARTTRTHRQGPDG